uniref:Uncharacterized protein n=1 Tax=Arundo donax TaxID=35708 RepID=A0A0A9DPF4_ARUDO
MPSRRWRNAHLHNAASRMGKVMHVVGIKKTVGQSSVVFHTTDMPC